MVKKGVCLFIFAAALFCREGWAVEQAAEPKVFSSDVAGLYLNLAQELVGQADPAGIEPATTFIEGAWLLDEETGQIAETVLGLAPKAIASQSDLSKTVKLALDSYVDSRSDLVRISGGIQYLVERLDTRQDREKLLTKLLADYLSKNPLVATGIETQLGILAAERADYSAAIEHFSSAYTQDTYNQLAYGKLLELSPPSLEWHSLSARILFLRRQFEMNPADLALAAAFADAARQGGLYQEADDAFRYAAALFSYYYPNQSLPETIAWPWSVSCFNQQRRLEQCIVLAEQSRQTGRFSILLEALAGLAAEKTGKQEQARDILDSAAGQAEKLAKTPGQGSVRPELLGWFYCFVRGNPEKALAWCNRAYLEEPQNPDVKSLMAYAFALNDQWDLAQEYAAPFEKQNPTAAFVIGLYCLRQDKKDAGLDALKSAMAMDSDSPIALKVAGVLKENGSEYIRPAPAEILRQKLKDEFGPAIVPDFIPPEKLFSARLSFNGEEFFYGADPQCQLIIENKNSRPMIIRPNGLVSGHYRLDVNVRGDLNAEITGLLSGSFQPARPLRNGEYASIGLNVLTGKLDTLLFTCPQANLEIEFLLYLDPQQTASTGNVQNTVNALTPIKAVIRRKGVDLTRDFIIQRLDTLAKGRQGQKMRAADLFVGLMAEQNISGNSRLPYKYYHVERELFVDAVRKALLDQDWKVRVHTMALMARYSLPLDFSMVATVSENLSHDKWPVRLSALYLLARGSREKFSPVLDWTAKNDPFWLNRKMALVLGASTTPGRAEP